MLFQRQPIPIVRIGGCQKIEKMRKPTKKQLRDKISELQNDLFRSIAGLPDGELKQKMAAKYPDYFFVKMLDKYGSTPFVEEMLEIFSIQPANETGDFFWYEKAKS